MDPCSGKMRKSSSLVVGTGVLRGLSVASRFFTAVYPVTAALAKTPQFTLGSPVCTIFVAPLATMLLTSIIVLATNICLGEWQIALFDCSSNTWFLANL